MNLKRNLAKNSDNLEKDDMPAFCHKRGPMSEWVNEWVSELELSLQAFYAEFVK